MLTSCWFSWIDDKSTRSSSMPALHQHAHSWVFISVPMMHSIHHWLICVWVEYLLIRWKCYNVLLHVIILMISHDKINEIILNSHCQYKGPDGPLLTQVQLFHSSFPSNTLIYLVMLYAAWTLLSQLAQLINKIDCIVPGRYYEDTEDGCGSFCHIIEQHFIYSIKDTIVSFFFSSSKDYDMFFHPILLCSSNPNEEISMYTYFVYNNLLTSLEKHGSNWQTVHF